MKRLAPSFLALAVIACSSSTPPPAANAPATAGKEKTVEERNAELLQKHTEIWNLMGLSKGAQDELNGIVVAVNKQMAKNKVEKPEAFAAAKGVERHPGPMTHEDYLANHRKRFDFLKISEPTQAELMQAAEFVWTALHDPNVPADKKATAETIQSMMKAMSGPPPCCDDNIFKRAAP